MRSLLTLTALIEPVAGLALLGCPSTATRLLVGESLETEAAATVARIGGAGLLAIGAACWFARGDSRSRAAKGLVAGTLLYNVAAVCILADAGLGRGLHGVLLWPGVLLHALMALWCAACFRQSAKRTIGISTRSTRYKE
jgi:hypothetical protein